MKIAIFSDVHGNLSALEAVLGDCERHGVDSVIFAGDLCLMGPRPAACLQLVRDRRLPAVIGNTDEWTVGGGAPPDRLRPHLDWTRASLTGEERDWLGRLPFALRVSPTPRAADDLLIVHANPRALNDIIFPSEADQRERWGDVRQSDAQLAPLLAGLEAGMMAYGHLHIPGFRAWGATTLVNISSVSMPGDGDPRAKYAVLEWDGHWSAEHQRVAYDLGGEIEAFRANRPPDWEVAVAAIEAEGWYYPQRI